MDEFSEVIQRIVNRLVAAYRPQRIILFGSFAYGVPTDDSDIDMLIIRESGESPFERRVRVRRLVADPERSLPFSPLVLTPAELAQRLRLEDPFYKEILSRGKVLYATD